MYVYVAILCYFQHNGLVSSAKWRQDIILSSGSYS